MSHDPSDAGMRPGEAVFLPAFQLPVVGNISNPQARAMFPGSAELNWFNPDNEHWSYCAGLYSLGQSSLDLDNPAELMLTQRDRSRTLLVADSGGYQLGKNTFKAIEGKMSHAFLRTKEYDDVRRSVLRWMETYADFGMIIDFPAWAIGKEGYIFSEFSDCLRETKRNMEFFRDEMVAGTPLKLLSVVQGRSIDEAVHWYNAIKSISNFPYAGWSFAGPVVSDPTITLRMILKLLKDGRLSEKENWLHLLGRASPSAVFVFTVLQECLDDYVGKNIKISYDVSSPFKTIGQYGKVYSHLEIANRHYSMPLFKYSEMKSLVKEFRGYLKRCEWCGPFDKDVDLNDLHVPVTEKNPHGLDGKSVAYLAHRNVYIYSMIVNIIVHNVKSLREPENNHLFIPIFRKFRSDVRAIFDRFASGGMSDDDIVYLNISRDYEGII